MPIDKFSKQEFEAALPQHKDTDEPLSNTWCVESCQNGWQENKESRQDV